VAAATAAKLPALLEAMEKKGATLVIIDTPAPRAPRRPRR